MQKSIIAEKLQHDPPDIYIRPEIIGIDILEFFRADEVYEQADPARQELRNKLEDVLGITA